MRKLVVGHSPYEYAHDGYSNVEESYTTQQKLGAIARLNFDGAVDYPGLKQRTPSLADVNKALRDLNRRGLI